MLLAFGENKAGIAAKAVEGLVTAQVPASFLQEHPDAAIFLDIGSSSGEADRLPPLHKLPSPCNKIPFSATAQTAMRVRCWVSRSDESAEPLGPGSSPMECSDGEARGHLAGMPPPEVHPEADGHRLC